MPSGETMSEGSDLPAEETAQIPAGLVPDYPNVGDTIQLRVVATDPEAGIITVGPAMEGEEPAEPSGSDDLAAEFDEAGTQQPL